MLSAGALANRKGLLIDFDHAIYQAENDTEPWSDDDNVYDDNDRDCAPVCKEVETSVEGATDVRQDDEMNSESLSEDDEVEVESMPKGDERPIAVSFFRCILRWC